MQPRAPSSSADAPTEARAACSAAATTGGDQLAACTGDDACDPELGCYDDGPGTGFCSARCEDDTDCADIDGAEYTCSEGGLCEIRCEPGPEGALACPEGTTCTQVSGPGPGGLQLRCKYPAVAGSGEAYAACLMPDDCDDGLECVGALLAIPGYCTQSCEESAECAMQPSSGSIEPSCELNTCVLACADDPEGCPDGMTCVETPLFSGCAYQ